MAYSVDLNCDIGESYFTKIIGNDAEVMPFISSCNIACGLHGGDPLTIQKAIESALSHKVNIGAHPSFPDMENFGRKYMNLSSEELKACLRFQIGALDSMTKNRGGVLRHVKPHGALYNTAAKEYEISKIIVDVIKEFSEEIVLLGMANSEMEKVAEIENIPFIAEVFADRNYTDEGLLVSRGYKNAVITDEKLVVDRSVQMILKNEIMSVNNKKIEINAQSICVHGDTKNALNLLKSLRTGFANQEIEVRPFL